MTHPKILIAEDEAASRAGLQELLSGWGYEVTAAADGQEAVEKASDLQPSLIIADLVMPKMDGITLLRTLKTEAILPSLIILTGHGTIETAVQAMREGAYDYLTKPVDIGRLHVLVEKALERGAVLKEVKLLRHQVRHLGRFGELVGDTRAIREVYRLLELAAPSTAPVFVWGESGTGKELAARTIHTLSARKQGPFVPINCAAIPETLLESEIFGHEKGAFTGATERRMGYFELADGGTIFLDEIAEMKVSTQAKFLRILQEGSFRRLGGAKEIRVDVRVVAATNKDPARAVQDGLIREDLYYRLNVFSVHLPPLRERREDIPLLIRSFLEEFTDKYGKTVQGVDTGALALLTEHDWPGNVRELRNALERAVLVAHGNLITPADLPPDCRSQRCASTSDFNIPIGITVDAAEKVLILTTLERTNQNKTKAAEILGISLKTLHNKLARYREETSSAADV
ncbi:acetoacetate metabolism regulatory protein AtoC [Candidatus Methylomirabilis lanthanidiphila]|uniref:Acetoacetate metabolism regulatory protein AtoC n=1 Tax=Candidatus Methylomirabilis lanthanidiphila TaxID=2211376 RepID=A0A564ZLU0_9BACT|nr:sigma-54 dependent transcriptional regulator [Candidatus Methylomirabilis lanthanidiphila]VUZ86056.1 acetoacetate metabolism regulatory protein AtoC [Candidatus Methylomirabilis lanthanidiphila]